MTDDDMDTHKCKNKMDGIWKDLMSLNTKAIYNHLIEIKYRDIRATGERKWEELFNIEQREWKLIYSIPYNATGKTKLQSQVCSLKYCTDFSLHEMVICIQGDR